MKREGFTLIELLAVLVILAVIALITIPILFFVIENSRKNTVKESVNSYIRAVEATLTINVIPDTKKNFSHAMCFLSQDTMNCTNNSSFLLKIHGEKLDVLRVEFGAQDFVEIATFQKGKYCGKYVKNNEITFMNCEGVNKIDASSVSFTPKNPNWKVDNVASALDDLYRK